jgi:hypothetical protein
MGAILWRPCIRCGVFFERTLMHSDPCHRSEFGKPAFVCTDCRSYIDRMRLPTTSDSRSGSSQDRTIRQRY